MKIVDIQDVKINDTYYDLIEDIGHNANIYILTGGRGIGKTYNIKKFMFMSYLNSHMMFLHFTLTLEKQKALKADKGRKFFSGVFNGLMTEIKERGGIHTATKNEKLLIKLLPTSSISGNVIYLGKEPCGELYSLGSSDMLKECDFDKFKFINLPEFISQERLNYATVIENLNSISESVCRTRAVTMFLHCNVLMESNPILKHFKADNMQENSVRRIYIDNKLHIYIRRFRDSEKLEEKRKEMSNISYTLNALGGNTYAHDNDRHKYKGKPKGLTIFVTLVLEHINLKLYKNYSEPLDKFYIVSDSTMSRQSVTFDPRYLKEGVRLDKTYKQYLIEKYSRKQVEFCDKQAFELFEMYILNR